MVDCARFFSDYSDFRDGLLEVGEQAGMAEHLSLCASCARYDRVVTGGVGVMRSLPEVQTSDDFLARLEARIRVEEAATVLDGQRGSGAPFAMTVAIAAALAAIAWSPLARPRAPLVSLPPVAAHAPYREEALHDLFRPGPLLLREAARPAEPGATLLFRYSPLATPSAVPALHTH